MSLVNLVPIDAPAAADWIRGSLAQGSDLSALISAGLRELPVGAVICRPTAAGPVLDDLGRGISSVDADEIMRHAVESMGRHGARTIVVEDDLARRDDFGLPADVAFVGDRVLRWAALDADCAVASRLLRTGSSGFPLNAFVLRSDLAKLPLTAGQVLSDLDVSALAETACAVVTSVYDAESFVILAAAGLGLLTI